MSISEPVLSIVLGQQPTWLVPLALLFAASPCPPQKPAAVLTGPGVTVQVRVIIIDSITFHFRQDFKDMAHRTRVLTQMAQDLMALSERHTLAVSWQA